MGMRQHWQPRLRWTLALLLVWRTQQTGAQRRQQRPQLSRALRPQHVSALCRRNYLQVRLLWLQGGCRARQPRVAAPCSLRRCSRLRQRRPPSVSGRRAEGARPLRVWSSLAHTPTSSRQPHGQCTITLRQEGQPSAVVLCRTPCCARRALLRWLSCRLGPSALRQHRRRSAVAAQGRRAHQARRAALGRRQMRRLPVQTLRPTLHCWQAWWAAWGLPESARRRSPQGPASAPPSMQPGQLPWGWQPSAARRRR